MHDRQGSGDVRLFADHVTLAYDRVEVARDLSVAIAPGQVTTIVGANACGKSTLLRALARLLRPTSGTVVLDGQSIHAMPTRTVAHRLGILPQSPIPPDGITVGDLVARGRYPHQGLFRIRSADDVRAVAEAMAATGTTDLAERPVDELSGGQRQRAWIAMALAQQTDILLLDEPTTFLDLAHQVEVLDLLTDLNRDHGRTVVLVLHDINQACRYSDHIMAMKGGRVVVEGPPSAVVTEQTIRDVFDLECRVVPDPVTGTPMVVPLGRHARQPLTAALPR